MILLEGPDGGGKTTLLGRLSRDTELPAHTRASDSLTGPLKDLYGWTVADITTWHEQPLSIYDRHPLTSEHIYGPTVRGQIRQGFEMKNPELARMRKYMRQHAFVVICLPPFAEVQKNVASETGQMPGVIDNIKHIYDCYQAMLFVWPIDAHIAWFDYTVADDEKHGYNEILAAAKLHQHSWRHVPYDKQ